MLAPGAARMRDRPPYATAAFTLSRGLEDIAAPLSSADEPAPAAAGA